MGHGNAKDDAERYRAGYPGQADDLTQNDNLRFYRGEIPSIPDGDYIDKIHQKWFGDYDLLEIHHGYIQWLFPIREHGMNHQSSMLQPHEIEAMRADQAVVARVLRSFDLMLDFYGMRIKSRDPLEFERTEHWQAQYRNLNTSSHNYLRITRILKCLGEMGLEHMKKPWVMFLIDEAYSDPPRLPSIRTSLANYWIAVLKNDAERDACYERLYSLDPARRPGAVPANSAGRPMGGMGGGAGGAGGSGGGGGGGGATDAAAPAAGRPT